MDIKEWLLYLTNNERESRHEVQFDIAFLIINTFACIVGGILFVQHNEPEWIAVLIIEYTWALDSMRHNR